ncbi:type II toxin-antitoxin system VapC family toxin [Protofrankia coriariae]|uniref:Ribonuclease VapC n=1 Tax=Protofrankia coriariae TaxID=1562887 RepID=A0ABR5EYV8_9ACTN|nr:PIN domain-containing protein [Protofrankia coriariae]KLL09641.1 twitching motility protein PilT [Protofrankia coriariae]
MIVVDTGPVVAVANRKDDHHRQCVDLLQNFPGPLLLPAPLLSEIGYMLFSRAGAKAEANFLRDVADGVYELAPVTPADAHRAADLVERYASLPLGTADAFVVAVAEKFQAVHIATLDRRHFSVVRPSHVPAFTLLP